MKFREIETLLLRLRPLVGYWIETDGAVLSIVKFIRESVPRLPALSFADIEMLCLPSMFNETLKVVLAQLVIATADAPSREYVQEDVLTPELESETVKFREIETLLLRLRPLVGYWIVIVGATLSTVKLPVDELPMFPAESVQLVFQV